MHFATPHYILQLWVRWPLQPLQKSQPPVGPSVDSLCHPWFTTTNLSYNFLSLKIPPPLGAVLLVDVCIYSLFTWTPWTRAWVKFGYFPKGFKNHSPKAALLNSEFLTSKPEKLLAITQIQVGLDVQRVTENMKVGSSGSNPVACRTSPVRVSSWAVGVTFYGYRRILSIWNTPLD